MAFLLPTPSACNQEISDKKISLHIRIKEWYTGTGENCLAIEKQNYLKPNTLKNDTLKAIMRRDNLSHNEAIEKIIFQHQLPLALIKYILYYGAIIPGENSSITVIAPVEIYIKNKMPLFCHAEITGKVCHDHIKIWHTFLRDNITYSSINSEPLPGQVCLYQEIDQLVEQITREEKILHAYDDLLEGFLPPETEDTLSIVHNHRTYITIEHKNIHYNLMKNIE